jgi:hypothetical protein
MEAQTSKSLWRFDGIESFTNYMIMENIQIRVNRIANDTSGPLSSLPRTRQPVRN